MNHQSSALSSPLQDSSESFTYPGLQSQVKESFKFLHDEVMLSHGSKSHAEMTVRGKFTCHTRMCDDLFNI